MKRPICFFSILYPLLGWDQQGHKIVARIAANLMQDETRNFLTDVAGLGPDVASKLAFISIQPDTDIVLQDPRYKDSGNLHFAFTDSSCSRFDLSRDCPKGECIVTGLSRFALMASDPKQSRDVIKDAIMFVVHFMADIHQPLHIGFRGDEGGRFIFLTDPRTTLHNVWDVVLYEHYMDKRRPFNKHRLWNYFDLASDLVDEMKSEKVDYSGGIEEPNDTSILCSVQSYAADIASETTSKYTCDFAYANEKGDWIMSGDKLDAFYMDDRSRVVIEQFKVAGFRLAALLDKIAATYLTKKLKMQNDFKDAPVLMGLKPASKNISSPGINKISFADLVKCGKKVDNTKWSDIARKADR